ncbi:MAG: hypothetical protein GC185_02595 [Alphaproteobacteria bacterium]|nr:hypothetical protein [Alphaproteobacteria bacterium]
MAETDTEKNLRHIGKVIRIVRPIGGALMLAGVAVAFNLGGILRLFGPDMKGGDLVLGIAIFVMGVVDYFVVPNVLKRAKEQMEKDGGNSNL